MKLFFKYCVVLGALALLIGPSGWAEAEDPPDMALEVGNEVGQLAPDFTLPILDGEDFHLYEEVQNYDATLLMIFLAAT